MNRSQQAIKNCVSIRASLEAEAAFFSKSPVISCDRGKDGNPISFPYAERNADATHPGLLTGP